MISLVIATYNRGERLAVTLDSLVGQTLSRSEWELVVVDNNSDDNSAEVVRRFAELNPRYFFETRQGVSYARNRGIAESRGEWIVFIDDDVIMPADFLETYAKFIASHPEAVAIGGRIVPRPEADPPRWMSRYPMTAIGGGCDYGKREFFPRSKSVVGANNALSRRIVEIVGDYNPALGRSGRTLLSGEEKDLSQRIVAAGYRIHYLGDAWLYHLVPEGRMTREYFTKLCYLLGYSEKVRTMNISRWAYLKRLLIEVVKWGGAAVFAFLFLLRGAPSKGGYLLLMRWEITKGLFTKLGRTSFVNS